MFVKAAPGVAVPMEGAPRQYITDAVAQDVPETAYYLRRVADGDLVVTQAPAAPQSAPEAEPQLAATRKKGDHNG